MPVVFRCKPNDLSIEKKRCGDPVADLSTITLGQVSPFKVVRKDPYMLPGGQAQGYKQTKLNTMQRQIKWCPGPEETPFAPRRLKGMGESTFARRRPFLPSKRRY